MVRYIIPGFYEHAHLNLKLISLMKTNPEYFNDNTSIHACYGNFQYCIFDGGRSFKDYRQATKEDVNRISSQFNSYGVPIRFVFTNNQLQESDYHDRFCNMILNECENGLNEVVIADENLEKYIREHYPQYQFISSTTKCLSKPEELKEELSKDNYYMVCLDYNLNKNMKMLEALTHQERQKCEFLINAICAPGCPNRKEHYKLNSLFSLNYGKRYQMEQCMINNAGLHPEVLHQRNNLTPDEIYNIYEPMGFEYYKIEGRTWSDADLIATYAYYMVKPEYQFFFVSLMTHD